VKVDLVLMRPFGPLAALCLLFHLFQLVHIVHTCKEIKLKFDLQRMVERTAKKICAGTPRITRGMGTNITLEPGERAEFLCAVDHSCMVSSIKWFHATPDNLTITLIKTAASPGDPHVHLIPSVLPSHSGTYSCVAENVLGQTKAEAYLAVNSAPTPHPAATLNVPIRIFLTTVFIVRNIP